MERQGFPWERVAAACIAVLVLNLAGVIWLGLANERLREQVVTLSKTVAAAPRPATADTAGIEGQIAALRAALDKLTAKVQTLSGRDESKALDRLTAEVKTLAGRVEGLGSAKTAPAKAAKGKKAAPADENAPPRPVYGPGYPAWPGY